MRTRNHNTTTPTTSWCHQAQRAVVVVRPASGQVPVVLMDSITSIAAAKPAPSGQDRGVP
ncbi:MAG: hypothetical protein FJ148_01465 [Deltaproteobacteria bacterium]|nr:hypothetical protein [Deltaproteobacteria bacterium]